jgi:autotransporter-associated beta strand protein
LKVGNASSIPTGSGKGDVTVDGTLDLNTNNVIINGLSGSGTVDNATGSGAYLLTIGDNNRSGTFSGVIKNSSGTVAVSKIGTGTITLSGASTYGGDTTVSQGTLKLGSSNVLPDGAGKGNLIANGTVDLAGYSETINGLAGTGVVRSGTNSPILTIGNNDSSSTFSGIISNSSGSLSLIKVGAGTLTLSGNNACTGNTIVNGGTLVVNGTITSPSVTVNSPGTLAGGGILNGVLLVQSGAAVSPGTSIGTLTISNSVTLSGNTIIEINKTGAALTSDLVQGITVLTQGGTLTVTASGDALVENDTFNLFDATSFVGSFATINLPTLSSCFAWDISRLSIDGTIRVIREKVTPVIASVTATESAVNVKNCANSITPGSVNIAVQASDNCAFAFAPSVVLTNGANTQTAVFVNENPSGTFNYTWIVTSGTPTGTWDATATATDTSGNAISNTFTLCVVQQFQVTGLVELQSFVGSTRAVTFVATSSSNTPLLTNTQTLTFTGATVRLAPFTLNVPVNTANISAKSAWTLRKKLAVTFPNGQGVANFNNTTRLLAGDISNPPQDNRVNTTDNTIFKIHNGKVVATTPAAAQADMTGDGRVNTSDYTILKSNLGKIGDAQ